MNTNTRGPVDVFHDRVTTLRNELKMTQEQFAKHCGLMLTDINNLTRKKKIPSEVMIAIADKCNVSTDWLLGRTTIRETATDTSTVLQNFDYSKVTAGDLNRILAYAAACGIVQIISPNEKNGLISLRVLNKELAEFLRRLQKKAIDVITDQDDAEFLTDWFEKKCANDSPLASFLGIHESIDKYHGAFPWSYICAIDKDYDFDFTDAEWRNDDPSDEWNEEIYEIRDYAGNCILPKYKEYRSLFDGITGYYYYPSSKYPNAPTLRPHQDPDEDPDTDLSFMNIPDELPFN